MQLTSVRLEDGYLWVQKDTTNFSAGDGDDRIGGAAWERAETAPEARKMTMWNRMSGPPPYWLVEDWTVMPADSHAGADRWAILGSHLPRDSSMARAVLDAPRAASHPELQAMDACFGGRLDVTMPVPSAGYGGFAANRERGVKN